MAGDWIKIEHCLPGKPEVMELARIMQIDEMTVVGHLVCFWSWADQNLSPECPATSGTKRGLDRVAGRDGFVDAMVQVNWLTFDGQTVQVPNYEHHLSQSAKKRGLESRKKQRQRKPSRICPATIGTESGQNEGPEKRREEITTEGEPQGAQEYIIPKKLDDDECRSAAKKWFAYLVSKGLEDKSPDGNDIAIEEWWRQMARFGREDYLEAVSESIAAGRWNVKKDRPSTQGAVKSSSSHSPEFIQALAVCRQFPDDWRKREAALPQDIARAVKATGSAQFLAAKNDWDLKTVAQIFDQHLKAIREGVVSK
jgi:hypothetical protein